MTFLAGFIIAVVAFFTGQGDELVSMSHIFFGVGLILMFTGAHSAHKKEDYVPHWDYLTPDEDDNTS